MLFIYLVNEEEASSFFVIPEMLSGATARRKASPSREDFPFSSTEAGKFSVEGRKKTK